MRTSFYTNKTAMVAQQAKLDLISNNISNSSTNGYKRLSTSFQDLYRNSLDRLGIPAEDKTDLAVGTGVKTTNALRILLQGSLRNTGLATDLAIDGEGMFRVIKADGSYAYTRNGNFVIDSAGNIVDNNGNRLSIVDENGREVNMQGVTSFKSGNFSVDKNGVVSTEINGNLTEVGKINLYTSVGNEDFISVGENLFVPIDGVTPFITTSNNIWQNHIENSNVDMATEMSDMIVAQRAFQLSSTALKTADEMWKMVNNLR